MGHIKLTDIDLLDVGNTIRLAGAIYHGNGKVFLAFLPDERGEMRDHDTNLVATPYFRDEHSGSDEDIHVLDMDRDDWTAFLRQSDILEVQALQEQPDGKLAKAILRKSQRQIAQTIS